jgi:quinohemoprotein ethanol dehydrogenase
MTVSPVDDPAIELDDAMVRAGQALSAKCAVCHGVNLESAGAPAPDLRESQIALSEPAFNAVIHDGALLPKGMPRFENLTSEQVHAIWSYIRWRARETKRALPSQ